MATEYDRQPGESEQSWRERMRALRARYDVVRFYFDRPGRRRVILRNVTLEQAQAHCSDPNTSSSTATSAAARRVTRRNGAWFDGYQEAR